MDHWQVLKVDLHKESEAISHSSGEIVLVESSAGSDSEITLSAKARNLKLTFDRERHAVKWGTEREYRFERLSESTGPLTVLLMKRLQRRNGSLHEEDEIDSSTQKGQQIHDRDQDLEWR